MSEIGVGIIGTGYIATACHAPAVLATPSARLAAVLSRQNSLGFLSTVGAGDARPYDDLDAFLADPDIDLVVIASPDALHVPQAAASLRAGKHVLVEKPVALGESEARSLVDLAGARGLVLASGYHLRCHPGHRALRSLVREGALGALRHLRMMWSYPMDSANWRASSEFARWWSLSATATHCLDLARWFADDADEWAALTAVLSNTKWHGPREESAAIAARLASGPTVEVLSSVLLDEHTRVEIFGDDGVAVCTGTLGPDGGGDISVDGEPLAYAPGSPFLPQLDAVLAAISGEGQPVADGEVGARAVRDLELAAGSS